ncbi:MAG: HAMP domain-containing protein [Lachnospiraceae bacterium]|jgi:signal transduction histidine kinase|nr:HAMP domain-containing protein [Lachnospiraceae bacterium]MBP5564682.1 HAMP domain-containing protein [Lachnospiraceae bacterium]MBQ4275372.1 HAMP domain-containing protein [Lachnospiraceae bacterium]
MRKTVYTKLILAYLLFALFGFLVIATFVSRTINDLVVETEADKLYREAIIIADTYATDLYNSETSLETVKKQLDYLDRYLDSTLWIMNPSGLIVLSSDLPIDVENPASIEGFDSTDNIGGYYTVGNFYGYFESDVLSVFAPISNGFQVQGYVVIHKSIADLNKLSDRLLAISYYLFIILFVLSLIILIFFTMNVYRPLRKITKATEEYAAGNLHYQFQIDSEDELGYLAASLNYMAGELAKGEDNQKQLVANVSHDFRSPLTSIKGYSEAMLDGTIPPELHAKYLEIVTNESDRLIKLTNSLLTLNNLNTEGMILEISDFDINTVIRKTIATFEGVCVKKRISIELSLSGEHLFVKGDITKIQQVLYNLLDNAIKFSNKDSKIFIETKEKHKKVFVSVKDQGIGIPKESLNQIWDRFYKTDLSRGKDKKGTGLGLSITREIIRAHGENINCISTEGEGTEFVFTLTLSEINED